MKTMKNIQFIVLAAAALSLLLSGCAQDMGEVDRTQTNILDKQDLEGEWYFRQTTLSTPYSSGYTFEGDTGQTERGVFEIQEDHVYFYRTYEFSLNSQQHGMKSDVDAPLLLWLADAKEEWTSNPYQARDKKFATGTALIPAGGDALDCGRRAGKHDWCKEQLANEMAYCGHEASMGHAARTKDNAICVTPTRLVFKGAPVAVFPIDSHFDIRYEYNSGTGEKTNVLVENSSDLFWYERGFMRVNWADTQVDNYSFSLGGLLGDVNVTIYEGDAGPEETKFRMFRDDDDVPSYFDYVGKYIFAAPAMYNDYYGFDIPICFYYPWYVGGVYECTSEQIEIRTAFMKVDLTDTYVPAKYDDHMIGKFGFFRAERIYWDEHYDATYSGAIRYANRHDMWEEWILKDDGTPDYAKMTPKPVVYYLNRDFPREFVPQMVDLGAEWAQPLDDIVTHYKGEGGVPATGMFVVCENNNQAAQDAIDAGLPVAETDPSICMDMDYVKYHGDLRYSFIHAVNEPNGYGLLGYGPPSYDPLTGKIISGNAHMYTASMLRQANYAADVVEYLAGAKDYMTTAEAMDKEDGLYGPMLSVNNNPPPSSIEDAQNRIRNAVSDKVANRMKYIGMKPTDQNWAQMRMNMTKNNPELEAKLLDRSFRALHRDTTLGYSDEVSMDQLDRMALRNWANHAGYKQKMDLFKYYAKKTMYREEFMDGAIAGRVLEWKARYDNEVCDAVAAAAGEGAELAFDLDEFNLLKGECDCALEGQVRGPDENPTLSNVKPYDPTVAMPGDVCTKADQGAYTGCYWLNACTVTKLGLQVSNKIIKSKENNQWTYWKPSPWYANTKEPVIMSSQDLVKGELDRLRADMIEAFMSEIMFSVSLHEVGHTVGLRHNFEGSTDAMNFPKAFWDLKVTKNGDGTYQAVNLFARETDYQQRNKIRELQYSTIMDYGSKFNDQWHGLGAYDRAALKFGYGGLVEVFNDAPDMSAWTQYLEEPDLNGYPELAAPVIRNRTELEVLFKKIHYTQMPNVFGDVDAIYNRKDVEWTGFDAAPEGEVAYRFCSDELVGQTPTCHVWDAGADPYEITINTIDDYWWYWIFWGHWRQSLLFHYETYSNRVLGAFKRIQAQFQWWAVDYMRYNNDDWWEKKFGMPWEEDPMGGLTGSMATLEGFKTLLEVFSIPQGAYPGVQFYGFNNQKQRYETVTSHNRQELANYFVLEENIGKFSSRPLYPSYVFLAEMVFPASGGSIYDRLHAFATLTDPTTDFLNIDEFPDHRRYLISYYTFFPNQLLNLLGGLTTHREENYAPCIVENDEGKPQYLKTRDPQNIMDPNFCADGHYLEPEPVDYDFPTTWYRIPMLAAYYGMSMMINDYDRRFMDTTRIFLKGHEDAIDLPEDMVCSTVPDPDADCVEFGDPLSGKVYIAYKAGDGETFDTAFHLVNEALTILGKYDSLEELQDDYEFGEGELQRMVGLLELIRGMHKTYDYTEIQL